MLTPVNKNDIISIRQAIQRLAWKLGPDSEPTFGAVTLTDLTASRLIATDADKKTESVTDLTNWIAGTANEINVADDGDGTVTIGIVDPLIVAKGGSGAATFTDHSILLGSGTSAFTALGAATNGQLPIGSTGADPVLAAITGTPNQVTVTNGAGSITLSLPQDINTTDHPTFDYINLSTNQGVTGLTVTDHPTFDYITLSTSQGVTGLATTDHPTFDYIVLSTIQGITGLGTGDHPTFDYINLSTAQGVTGLTTSDSPTFNNLTLTGTANIRQLNPDNDNTYDIGESGRRWKDLYVSDITISSPSNIYALSHDSFADVHQDVNTDASPTFDDLTLTGQLGIGGSPDATTRLTIYSTDTSDQLRLTHDNTNAYITTTDGYINLKSEEDDNINTYVAVRGNGTGIGYFRIYDSDDVTYLDTLCTSGKAYIRCVGTSPVSLKIQPGAEVDVLVFDDSASGETKELKVYGYRAADAKRSLEIGVGVDAADTASFDGVSNYLFDGIVNAVGGFSDNGTPGIDTTFLDADGNTITVSGGIITAKTAP